MVSYTVDMPAILPQTDVYETWQDQEIATRILAYNSTNPLGISTYMNLIVMIYFPALILFAGALNAFSLYVLRSNFLRYLVIQPLLCALLHLQTLLLFLGPFYVWLVQCFRLYLSRYQLYPCFLVVWGHNFAALAISIILVAMMVERTLMIGRPEVLWAILQKACRGAISLLLVAVLVLGVGGFMCIDGAIEYQRVTYPICLPWWSNEHGLVNPVWYKILACCFTFGPSLLMIFSMALLVSSVTRFKQMIQSGSSALNHYNALYLGIRSTLHMKFVHSVWWLGSLFVFTSSPLGCFIIFGPAMYYRVSAHDYSLSASRTTDGTQVFNKLLENKSIMAKDTRAVNYPKMTFLDYSYLLVSRSDAETLLWTIYYSFTIFTVPVLLATEVLFRREWKEQLRKTINCLSRRNRCSRLSGYDITECDNVDLVGPYIATSKCQPLTEADVAQEKSENIQIYDAGKTVRAGRKMKKVKRME